MSISVAQMGARMHYAVPRILHQAGKLQQLFTDICATKGWPQLLGCLPAIMRPASVQRLLTRIPRGVPPVKICAMTGFGFDYARRLSKASSNQDRDEAFLWAGPEFCRLIARKGLGPARGIYGFNTGSLELFEHAAKRGIKCVLEQTITPRAIEQHLMKEESESFPQWEKLERNEIAQKLGQREVEEWRLADVILCASEYVKQGIIDTGGEAGKCRVVPYGIEQLPLPPSTVTRNRGKLRVLTVGAVGLRKGSPYVMKAAETLRGIAEFRMTGPHHCSRETIAELSRIVDLPGIVPRSEISSHYKWADVYLLPSLCEGSATSTYEAMLHGLPVICTPHTGSIVRDGVDGFIVPPRSPSAIVERLESLAKSPEMLLAMSESAYKRASDFTLAQYSRNLLAVLDSI